MRAERMYPNRNANEKIINRFRNYRLFSFLVSFFFVFVFVSEWVANERDWLNRRWIKSGLSLVDRR